MSDQTISLMSDETIEGHKARLRQYVVVLADFHDALVHSSLPSDVAREIVVEWWRNELEYDAG